jgi:phosphoglucosamine mutase
VKLFGTDGIRGRAGEGVLAPDWVRWIGANIGRLLKEAPEKFHRKLPHRLARFRSVVAGGARTVAIVRDTRASGPEIESALVEGLVSCDIHVRRAGVLPTPALAGLGCSLGIAITASHNPADDNGIKLISPEGLKVSDETEATIERLCEDGSFKAGPMRRSRARRLQDVGRGGDNDREVAEDLYDVVFMEEMEILGTKQKPKIVIDCANGATSAIAAPVFEGLGVTVVAIHNTPDGTNINRDCGAVYPQSMARRVVEEGAALGVAFDGDGDRAIFADERGTIRDGDDVLFLMAPWLKAQGELDRNVVVGTGMTNYGLELALQKQGIKLIRTAVGDRYVAEEMIRSGAMLGGEPSGHVINFHKTLTGDGIGTALMVLQILSSGTETFSARASGWTRFPQLLENVPVREKVPLNEMAPVAEAIGEADRALNGRGRVLVRYSGTEPLCRIMVEGPDAAELKDLARRIRAAVEERIGDPTVRQH